MTIMLNLEYDSLFKNKILYFMFMTFSMIFFLKIKNSILRNFEYILFSFIFYIIKSNMKKSFPLLCFFSFTSTFQNSPNL